MIRYYIWLPAIALLLSACAQSESGMNTQDYTSNESDFSVTEGNARLNTLFTQADAEKILGKTAYLKDSSTVVNTDRILYKCSYADTAEATTKEKTGVIYFMAEDFKEKKSAGLAYKEIYNANKNHKGIKVLNDFADEAYFHSDGENFYFILCRKGKKMIRIKVNKITNTTSLQDFNQIASSICAGL